MALINKETQLSEVIISEPTVITVLNRFGITLGVSDKSVQRICSDKGIDVELFLAILNTYINSDYFPEATMKQFPPSIIIPYLVKTNNYYKHFQIPNIERHFNLLIKNSAELSNNLSLMQQFFDELKQDITKRIDNDNNSWFPQILEHERSGVTPSTAIDYNDNIEEKLSDLKNMLVMHLNGDYDINLCYAVIFAIVSFEKDIIQNNRIRYRILGALYNSITN